MKTSKIAAWLAPRFTRLGHEAGRRIAIPGEPTSLLKLAGRFQPIPGMISSDRAVRLYALAYASSIAADVIEVGSWLGRATSFLAAACRDSHNGIVRTIDNFGGTVGLDEVYAHGESMDTQAERFRHHTAPLAEYIRMYQMDSHDAAMQMRREGVWARMLVIDGDHTYEGCRRDIDDFLPLLDSGGVLYFDDYSLDYPGVVRAAREMLAEGGFTDPIQDVNSLIVRRR